MSPLERDDAAIRLCQLCDTRVIRRALCKTCEDRETLRKAS